MIQQYSADIIKVVDIFSSIIGEYIWFVRMEEDRILRADFGAPHLTVLEPRDGPFSSDASKAVLSRRVVIPAGAWHLFVEDGFWSVQTSMFQCAQSDQDEAAITRCLGSLQGQKLTGIRHETANERWVFTFDLGGELRIDPSSKPDEMETWTLFRGADPAVSVSSQDRYVFS